MTESGPIRVALVEDDAFIRASIARAIRSDSRLELVAELRTATEAMRWLAEQSPQVLLVDLGLPDGSGIGVIAFAAKRHPRCDTMVVSMFGDEAKVLASIEAGAKGYLLKDAGGDEIARHIIDLHNGGSPMSPVIARQILRRVKSRPGTGEPGGAAPDAGPECVLTEREIEVIKLLSRGFTYAESAERLRISVNTVRTHINHIYRKFAVGSGTSAVSKAMRMGILDRGD